MTLTVTASVASEIPPRVLVEVDSAPSVVAPLKLFRVHEDGSRNRVLLNGRLIGGWSGYDYHPPLNEPFTYAAESAGQVSNPSPAQWVSSDQLWLIHPTDPDLSVSVWKVLGPQQAVTYSSRSDESQALRASAAMVRSAFGSWSPAESKLTIQVARDDVGAVKRLLSPDMPVLLNGPWGVDDLGWMWIQVKSTSVVNSGGFISFPTRNFELTYKQVKPPPLRLKPVWTLADVRSQYAGSTLADLSSVWASLGDMRIDRRV